MTSKNDSATIKPKDGDCLQMLNVKIEIDDGKKKATVELSETDNQSKLVIIQNVFNLFGINNDILEITDTFNKVGAAYSSFFNETNPIEPEYENKPNVEQQLIESYEENKSELEATYTTTSDQPDYLFTGIKERDGKKLYKCRYHCYACFTRSNIYIYENSKSIFCHSCRHELKVYPASKEGFPVRDTRGNFFRAGDYRDLNVEWD